MAVTASHPARRRLAYRLSRNRYHAGLHPRRTTDLHALDPSLQHTNGTGGGEENELIERQREHLMRLQADFENYRRRTRKEMDDIRQTASAGLIGNLLPIVDNFNRALDSQPGELGSFIDGVRMIRNLLLDQLTEAGLERIEAKGQKFDPNIHDAVAVDQSGEHEENVVVDVLQDGYRVRGRLIRPAMVRVSRS